MRTALIICEHIEKSAGIIRALESEHEIWSVARQRDAMAYLRQQQPETVVVDLDMAGLDVDVVLDAIHDSAPVKRPLIIGICENPGQLPQSVVARLEQLVRVSPSRDSALSD